jgi:tetraether lipid synthase
MSMQLRDHTFLGMTQSLCPECLALVPAKIIAREGRVYFRKRCATHGVREDFVCSDVTQYDRMEFSLQGKVPEKFGTTPSRGCPYDCGLCTEHEQHTCVGLVEITSSCNLHCPMCYASSGPGGKHLSFEECRRAIDRLVQVEGRAEVLQLSGGEPTTHPEFLRILEYACRQQIDLVMINSNGIRFARDSEFTSAVARFKHRLEVYLQFDGFGAAASVKLRGESLVGTKLHAIDELGKHGIRVILVSTLERGVNDHDIGALVKFGLERPWITGVSFQPATYSGRFPALSGSRDLESRITFPDVVRAVAEQTDGLFRTDDFLPLPCAHPNCHSLAYAYRSGGAVIPLTRFIDARNHLDILANGITFTRPRARQLIEKYLGARGCCAGGNCSTAAVALESTPMQTINLAIQDGRSIGNRDVCGGSAATLAVEACDEQRAGVSAVSQAASEFFARALAEQLSPHDVFRITITSFLDAYNFDVRRVMKCCIHHVLPSGHVIPFCAYNVLYREGHVPLPLLNLVEAASARGIPRG